MAKYTAYGSQLQIADDRDTPTVWTTIPNVGSMGFPLGTVDQAEVTTHDSPGRYREYVQTMRDGGEVSIELVLDYQSAVHQRLMEATGGLDYERFKVLAPDSTELAEFNAFVSLDGTSALPVDGAITATLNLRTTGSITLPWLES
jgi:Lambda phage tail tube protein, TTP